MNDTEYKRYIDNYYTANAKWMDELTRNVTHKLKLHQPNVNPLELITDSYLHLFKDKPKKKIMDAPVEKRGKVTKSIIINFCKMQTYWGKSDLIEKNRIQDNDQNICDEIETYYVNNEEAEEEYENRLAKERAELVAYNKIMQRVEKLNLPGRILYDMLYVEFMNKRTVARRIRLNSTSTYYMAKRLEDYLKGKINENDRIV